MRLTILFALVACPGTVWAAGGVQATSAWARATPPGQDVGAAYVTLTSPAADRLTRVATPIGIAQVHSMTMDGPVMRMRPVDALPLPAGQPVTLGPDGYHIMLTHLQKPLVAGQSFTMRLTFEHAPPLDVPVRVERLGARGPQS